MEQDFVIKDGLLKKYTGISENVVIPDGVTCIGEGAFQECKCIKSVIIPEGVKAIGERSFMKCLYMETISIPDSLVYVGEEAFLDCHSIKELRFPAQTVFQGHVIVACWNLKTIILPETINVFVPVESNKIECIVAPHVKINNVFETSRRHNNKRFAAAVGYIKYTEQYSEKDIIDSYNTYLFKHKKDLLPVVWENDAAHILDILAENGKISKKTIDSEYIEPAMKANAVGCLSFLMSWKHKNIKKSSIANTLLKIDKDPYSVTEMKKLWGYTNLDDGTIMITYYKGVDSEITVPPRIGESRVSRIGSYAFSPYMASDQGVYKRRVPKRVNIIKEIKSVIIPEGVTEICKRAFAWSWSCMGGRSINCCSSLTSVMIPSTVTIIGDEAFSGCSSLTSITIPDSLTSIGYRAFSNTPWLMSQPKGIISAGSAVVGYTGKETDLVIPDGIKIIGDYAFSECRSLTSVIIPDSVTSIGKWAFPCCDNLVLKTFKHYHPGDFPVHKYNRQMHLPEHLSSDFRK